MQLLILIAGIVGVIVPEQFAGQQEVGVALIAISVVLFVVQLVAFAIAARKVNNSVRDRNFPSGRF